MTSQFEDFDHDEFAVDSERIAELSTDNFELISAYLDGELSIAEKTQVQIWIDQDPELKAVYTSMLTLQSQMRNLEVPPNSQSTAEITTKVFQSLDRRRRQRQLLLGGGAAAASVAAAIMGLIPGIGDHSLRMAQSPNITDKPEMVMLAVALNKPAINIPKSVNGYDLGQP